MGALARSDCTLDCVNAHPRPLRRPWRLGMRAIWASSKSAASVRAGMGSVAAHRPRGAVREGGDDSPHGLRPDDHAGGLAPGGGVQCPHVHRARRRRASESRGRARRERARRSRAGCGGCGSSSPARSPSTRSRRGAATRRRPRSSGPALAVCSCATAGRRTASSHTPRTRRAWSTCSGAATGCSRRPRARPRLPARRAPGAPDPLALRDGPHPRRGERFVRP